MKAGEALRGAGQIMNEKAQERADAEVFENTFALKLGHTCVQKVREFLAYGGVTPGDDQLAWIVESTSAYVRNLVRGSFSASEEENTSRIFDAIAFALHCAGLACVAPRPANELN